MMIEVTSFIWDEERTMKYSFPTWKSAMAYIEELLEKNHCVISAVQVEVPVTYRPLEVKTQDGDDEVSGTRATR